MKKRIAIVLLLALLCCALSATALAASVTPNQRMSFRSGPNTRYTDLYTLPQNTRIVAFETEYGNEIQWVLLEFLYNGRVERAYTGLWRLDVCGYIPYANLAYQSASVRNSATVYAAPTANAAVRGRVGASEMVTYLSSECGYDYIEFYDSTNACPSRGYILSDDLYYAGDTAAFMTDCSTVFASPYYFKSGRIGWVGKYEMVTYMDYENGFAKIRFYDAGLRRLCVGYVPYDLVDTYNK